MGWCTGTEIAEEVWKRIKPHVPIKKHKEVTKALVDVFSEYDADDWEYYLSEKGSLYATYANLNCSDESEAHVQGVDGDD